MCKTNREISAHSPLHPPNFSHNIATFIVSLGYDLNGNIMSLDRNARGNGTAASLAITFIQHEEGRFRPNGNEMIYEYVIKDHASRSPSTGLGNTRITLRETSVQAFGDGKSFVA